MASLPAGVHATGRAAHPAASALLVLVAALLVEGVLVGLLGFQHVAGLSPGTPPAPPAAGAARADSSGPPADSAASHDEARWRLQVVNDFGLAGELVMMAGERPPASGRTVSVGRVQHEVAERGQVAPDHP